MAFPKQHWRNPRKTIASRYAEDDIAYATHGALVAVEAIKRLNIPAPVAAGLSLLDYGCGTGRMARVLAAYFGKVTAYDPVVECIQEAQQECAIPQKNLIYTSKVSDLGHKAHDVVVSINVMEHLTDRDQEEMLANVAAAAKPGATLLLWYAILLNRQVLVTRFGAGSWVAEDDAFLAKNPSSLINVRMFTL